MACFSGQDIYRNDSVHGMFIFLFRQDIYRYDSVHGMFFLGKTFTEAIVFMARFQEQWSPSADRAG